VVQFDGMATPRSISFRARLERLGPGGGSGKDLSAGRKSMDDITGGSASGAP